MSMKTWEKLSEDDRKIISDACARVTAMSIDLAEKDQEKHLKLLKESGVEVHTYSPVELEPIFTKVASTWDSLSERFSAELIVEFKREYGRE
jgi:TRAP-type C4-dicarboxylate transport system substrate-binding protein